MMLLNIHFGLGMVPRACLYTYLSIGSHTVAQSDLELTAVLCHRLLSARIAGVSYQLLEL